MNAEVRKARKKPVEIEYMVWPGGAASATPVIDWILGHGGTARYHGERWTDTSEREDGTVFSARRSEPVPEHIAIDTLEGVMRASRGDVIIRGVQGEFYPCRADIFRETYDPITTKETDQ